MEYFEGYMAPLIPAFPKPSQVRRKEEAVEVYPDGREVCFVRRPCGAGRIEYNARTAAMAQRQNGLCAICGNGGYLTFDHQNGRGAGGSIRDDRIEIDGKWNNAALCVPCNGVKGSKRYHWHEGKYVPSKPVDTD